MLEGDMEGKVSRLEKIVSLLVAVGFSLLAYTLLQVIAEKAHILVAVLLGIIVAIPATLCVSELHNGKVTPLSWLGVIAGHAYAYEQIGMRNMDTFSVQIKGIAFVALASIILIAEEKIRTRAKSE